MAKDPSMFMIPFVSGRLNDLSDFAGSSTANAPLLTGLGVATVGAMGLYWAYSGTDHARITPLVDPLKQTRVLEDGSRICANAVSNELRISSHSDANTLFEAVRRGERVSNNGKMLGYRQMISEDPTEAYVWLRYTEVINRSVRLAKGIRHLGLPVGQETFIGVYARNRPEWIVVEHAAYAFNNVLVPLYDTLGNDACGFIINQANIQLAFCDTSQKIEGLLNKKSECECLQHIVLMVDRPSAELTQRAADVGVSLHALDDVERHGDLPNVADLTLSPPTPDDLSTICYTSGTTGNPKGVMLTHGNIMADATVVEFFKRADLNKHDVMISFLPLAHMFERLVQAIVYSRGAAVGFFRGDIRLLAEDIKTLRPTILPAVPRVLNRLYDKVLSEVNKSKLKRFLFDAAVHFKTRELTNWVVRNDSFVDNLVFKKVREGLGGRVKLLITGSAPISESVLNFIRCAVGCVVVEGYGQTECVAACSLTIEGDYVPGHVGIPVPSNVVKLVDVPELGYFARDQAGEICIKGPNVFKGYYKLPELTSKTLIDGWLHTGDIGRWTERGTLKIVDRKKHIFKLAQGEYVAPEKIENIYTRSKYVAQCFVHGESLKTCLIAIVVPDPEVFISFAKSAHNVEGSLEELCRNDKLKAAILADLYAVGKAAGLFSFEQVKDIYLCAKMFSVDNDLLTPTLKSKRPQLKKHFKEDLDKMYAQLD